MSWLGFEPHSTAHSRLGGSRRSTTQRSSSQDAEWFRVYTRGEIDSKELQGVMKSLGVNLDETELANLMVQMDASGDGQV